MKLLLEHGASPDITNNVRIRQFLSKIIYSKLNKLFANYKIQNGQTPLAIAQRLGYLSVIEELKLVTQTTLISTTIKTTEEKYKVQTPETMQETFMSDSEDELGRLHNITLNFVLLFQLLYIRQRSNRLFRIESIRKLINFSLNNRVRVVKAVSYFKYFSRISDDLFFFSFVIDD